MKRKVLRKVDGHVSISESFTESEVDDLTELRERLRSTAISSHCRPLSAPPDVRHSVCTTTDHCLEQHRRPHTACREPSLYNLPEDYQGPKALIRPMSCDPHIRNIKKNDPVARYQEYQHCWTACRAPGEKAHKQLRWGVREKMLYHDQVVEKKPQRSYQPNTYVVPSDKKRKTLRWQIRMDLAQGVKPPSAFD
jgi:hydrolethalus syndrome protein 1